MGFGRKVMLEAFKKTNYKIDFSAGKYIVKTVESRQELQQSLKLRYQVFQVEMLGQTESDNLDQDQFDEFADHLIITDNDKNVVAATCRINHSSFCKHFYTEQEFSIQPLLENSLNKMEIGRVCINSEYRKGAVIILLWKAIAAYLKTSNTDILFGCGSVKTEDPKLALILFKYLKLTNKVSLLENIHPIGQYRSKIFEIELEKNKSELAYEEVSIAKSLLPPLCKAYFDIGCFVPCAPAFDSDFKCIDFLTVLKVKNLDAKIRQKMLGL